MDNDDDTNSDEYECVPLISEPENDFSLSIQNIIEMNQDDEEESLSENDIYRQQIEDIQNR